MLDVMTTRALNFGLLVQDWDGEPVTVKATMPRSFRLSEVKMPKHARLVKVIVTQPGNQVVHLIGPSAWTAPDTVAGSTYEFVIERDKGWGNRRRWSLPLGIYGFTSGEAGGSPISLDRASGEAGADA